VSLSGEQAPNTTAKAAKAAERFMKTPKSAGLGMLHRCPILANNFVQKWRQPTASGVDPAFAIPQPHIRDANVKSKTPSKTPLETYIC
jgi:hypothetical protein